MDRTHLFTFTKLEFKDEIEEDTSYFIDYIFSLDFIPDKTYGVICSETGLKYCINIPNHYVSALIYESIRYKRTIDRKIYELEKQTYYVTNDIPYAHKPLIRCVHSPYCFCKEKAFLISKKLYKDIVFLN